MKNSYMKYLVILLSLFISQLSIAASNLKINQLIQTVSQKSHRSKISSKMKEECLGYCALKIRHGEYDRSVLYFMDDSKELLSIYASKDNGQTWNNITDESSELRIESDNVLHENFYVAPNDSNIFYILDDIENKLYKINSDGKLLSKIEFDESNPIIHISISPFSSENIDVFKVKFDENEDGNLPRLKIYNSKNSGLDLEEYDTKFSEKDNYFSAVTEILNSSKNQNEKFAIVQYLDISKLEQGDDSFDYPDSYRVFKSIDFGKTWEPIIAETKFDKKNDSIYETRLSADDTIFLNTLYGYLNFIKKGNNENYSKVRNILSSNLINHLDINPIDPNEIILIKEYKDILNLRLEGSEWVTKNVKSFSFLNEEIKNLFFLSNLIN